MNISISLSYPRWLESNTYTTHQTSGITFVGEKNGSENFLLADDIGKIHHLKIKNDTLFSFSPVVLSNQVQAYLDSFPKADFEEIVFDEHENSVYLSIEGNGPDYKKYVGIFKVDFKNNEINSDTISGIQKLNIKPEKEFLKYTSYNIGYEGMAVDDKYIYLGLEGFSEDGIFADSTFILIVDKDSLVILKQINTKPYNIHTICGMFSDEERSVYGVDRNNKKLFYIKFNNDLEITNHSLTDIPTTIPGYAGYDYVAALESLSMNDSNSIFIIDDPWKKFYVPSNEILEKLDSSTINNFNNYVPIIFKFTVINKGE